MNPIPLSRVGLAGRTGEAADRAPVRIVHIGLGRFFRAHQAWYTAHATDAAEWGIAAFTGRSSTMADVLNSQDGVYSLIVRGESSDAVEIVTSVSEVHSGEDTARLVHLISDPAVAVITMTITEGGYRLLPDGRPDVDDVELCADVEALRDASAQPVLATAMGRLLAGLDARRRANAGPIAIVCCDNIPSNGAWLQRGAVSLAALVEPELADWIVSTVSFVSTSVDRITPQSHGDESVALAAGWVDAAPVVTEPFTDWVLAGGFPAGRPRWESAGARFVEDIEPWEQRKLWLLNGAHTLLAFMGQLKGLTTVDEAISDEDCRARVEAFWDEAVRGLPATVEHQRYRQQLIERFANPRIAHPLAQIATEATIKVQYRFAAVAEQSVSAGRTPRGTAACFAVWIDWVHHRPLPADSRAPEIAKALASTDPVRALVGVVSDRLGNDDAFLELVRNFRESESIPAAEAAPHAGGR